MSAVKLIISDLHLADGHSVLDGWGKLQQSALEGLLNAACSSGPLGQADEVELIINGDCFDFLSTPPYDTGGVSDAPTAVAKLEKIIATHGPFFEALRHFIETPGRSVTFTVGNHDIELCFAEVRARTGQVIGVPYDATPTDVAGKEERPKVYFCPTRFYRPLSDVYIEHGNHYDFWNHSMQRLWDERGQPVTLQPETITLPAGSHYFQHAAHPISIAYPYFDQFEPSINSTRQIALLSLLNPDAVVETVRLTMELLSTPRKALAGLEPGEERIPAKLFTAAMLDFAAFHEDVQKRKPDWADLHGAYDTQEQADIMTEFAMLRDALALPPIEAVAAICTPTIYRMGESVAKGMHNVLKNDSTLRYAIAAHTHMIRIDPVHEGAQTYLNTASWTSRFALPAPGTITPALVEWLRHPDWNAIPLRDVTQLTFAIVNVTPGGPSSASLCVWEGGAKGSYRVLA